MDIKKTLQQDGTIRWNSNLQGQAMVRFYYHYTMLKIITDFYTQVVVLLIHVG